MFNKSLKKDFGKKSMKKRAAALFLAGAMMLTACGKSSSEKKPEQNTNISTDVINNGEEISAETGHTTNLSANMSRNVVTDPTENEEQSYINATANLSFELLKYLAVHEEGNIMISPESIVTALTMTENGAGGNTLNEMIQVFCPDLTLEEYNKAVAGFNTKLTSTEPRCFAMANSIWVRNSEELKINSGFLQTNVDYHNAEFFTADFDHQTLTDVNNWVNDKTNGMIPETLKELNPDTQMLLINAAAFEAEWAEEYEENQIKEGETFTTAKGQEQKVTMLSSTESGYIALNGGEGFVKYYKGCDYAYVAILPAEGVSADEYLANLKGEDFVKAYQNRDNSLDVYVNMPEFKSDYETSLVEPFKSLGMNEAFSDNADFSGMLASSKKELKIGDIIHKTHIEVDRKGTKAAAVTVVEMDKCTAVQETVSPKFITLDRPFVYAIIETDTGLPVFLGTVDSIE